MRTAVADDATDVPFAEDESDVEDQNPWVKYITDGVATLVVAFVCIFGLGLGAWLLGLSFGIIGSVATIDAQLFSYASTKTVSISRSAFFLLGTEASFPLPLPLLFLFNSFYFFVRIIFHVSTS